MSPLAIRPARLSDALAMAYVHHDAVHALAGRDYGPEVLERWAPKVTITRAEQLFRETQVDGGTTLVAASDDNVLGFAIAMLDEAELNACYVAPSASRTGIGRMMVGGLEAEARRAGLGRFTVRAPVSATGFYFKLGYETVRTATYAFDDGVEMPVVIMQKTL